MRVIVEIRIASQSAIQCGKEGARSVRRRAQTDVCTGRRPPSENSHVHRIGRASMAAVKTSMRRRTMRHKGCGHRPFAMNTYAEWSVEGRVAFKLPHRCLAQHARSNRGFGAEVGINACSINRGGAAP
jgi:hypothetical protein